MLVIDAEMPEICDECPCCGIAPRFFGQQEAKKCSLTQGLVKGTRMPRWCPLIEVEEKRIRERVSHVDWQDRTVYVRKEETHDR